MDPMPNTCQRRGWSLPVLFLLSAGLCTAAATAQAQQQRLKADVLKAYSGLYATACDDSASPRLRVLPDALVVQQAGKRVTGRMPQSAYSYYGRVAPPQFKLGLMSRLASGGKLDFVVFEDRRGPYIMVLADDTVQVALGRIAPGTRFRRCEDKPQQQAARSVPPIPAQDEPVSDAERMLRDPQFRADYLRALGPLAKERWLARLEGPRPPTRQVRLEGIDFTLIAVCKPHDCADHNTALLYAANVAAEESLLYGKVVQDGQSTLIGNPPPPIAAALEDIWAAEWRRR